MLSPSENEGEQQMSEHQATENKSQTSIEVIDPDFLRFRKWCHTVNIAPSTGYELIKAGRIAVVKIGRGTFITREARQRFVASLEAEAQQS
jgi:hypothetical protein